MIQRTVIRAAAGTGKTERLAQEWLGLVQGGHRPRNIIAITFTRKAAAEFANRVAGVLLAARKDVDDAQRDAFELIKPVDLKRFARFLPDGDALLASTMAEMADSPLGTIDSFVQKLLAENALDARLSLGDGTSVSLDACAGGTFSECMARAARETVRTDPRCHSLLQQYGLAELATLLAVPRWTHLPSVALTDEVLGALTDSAFEQQHTRPEAVHAKLRAILGLDPPTATAIETALFEDGVGKRPPPDPALMSAAAAWLRNPTGPPEALVALWPKTKKALSDLHAADAPAPALLDAFAADSGVAILDALKFPSSSKARLAVVEKALTGVANGFAGDLLAWLESTPSAVPPHWLGLCLARLSAKIEPLFVAAFPEFGKTGLPGRSAATQRGFRLHVDGAPIVLPFDSLDELSGAQGDAACRTTADRLRTALDELRADVTRAALREAATTGALDYDTRLNVVTQMFLDAAAAPANPLCGRYTALLVDEVQDSSPAQVALYEAIEAASPAMVSVYVGDTRQSIYRFRGADPTGIERLSTATTGIHRADSLTKNHRSNPALAEAHRHLFGPLLHEEQDKAGFTTLEALPVPGPIPSEGQIPVHLFRGVPALSGPQVDAWVLAAFHKFLSGLPAGTEYKGAVLAPSWTKAADAVRQLKSRGGIPVFLDGGGRWLTSRVARDIRILLTALLDQSDEMAWLGVWKHPMVGLSDRALYRVRQASQVAGTPDAWRFRLGWLSTQDSLPDLHDEEDKFAFVRAAPALQEALRTIGSRPTAEVIESLAASLGWREIVAAGPDEDAASVLELCFDWLRTMDAEGRSAVDALAAFTADGNGSDSGEAPRLELQRPSKHISCTTVFQAKGLGYDYVCVLSPGLAPKVPGKGEPAAPVLNIHGHERRLPRVRFDPKGGLESTEDLVWGIAKALASIRAKEEELRLAYVAVTRAKQRVFLGIAEPGESPAQKSMLAAWSALNAPGAILIEDVDEKPDPASAPPPGGATVVRDWAAPMRSIRLTERTASGLSVALSPKAKLTLAESVNATDCFTEGWTSVSPGIAPPLDGQFKEVAANHWGDVAHSWMANWKFRGRPDRAAIKQFLIDEWQETRPESAAWLCAVCDALNASDTPLAKLARGESGPVELYFEHPLLGVLAGPGGDGLLSGRADLLVYRPDQQRWWVVDFKSGKFPAASEKVVDGKSVVSSARRNVISGASLRTYAPQLEAYAAAIRRAVAPNGQSVERVALWYLRSGGVVSWTPQMNEW